MESIATVQIFRDKRMTEAKSSRPESVGRHCANAIVVSVIISTTFEPQIEHFNDTISWKFLKQKQTSQN